MLPTGQDLLPLTRLLPDTYPERLRELAEVLYVSLISLEVTCKISREELAQIAIRQVGEICAQLGGATFYLMKGTSYATAERNQAIWRDFNGHNYIELARQYSLTEMQIRNIIEIIRSEEIKARQGRLEF